MFPGGGGGGAVWAAHQHFGKDEKEESKPRWYYFRKFLGIVRPYRYIVFLCFIAMVLVEAMGLALPWAFRVVIDSALARRDYSILHLILIGLVLLLVFKLLLIIVQTYSMIVVGQKMVADLRRNMHTHIQSLPLQYTYDTKVGGILSRIMSDVDHVSFLLFSGFLGFLASVLSLVMSFAILICWDWQLTLLCAFWLPVLMVWVARSIKTLRPRHKEIREEMAQLTARAEQVFTGLKTVKGYAKERRENSLFVKAMHSVIRNILQVSRLEITLNSLGEFVAFAGMTTLLWVGGLKVMHGTLTIGELVGFNMYLSMMFRPVVRLVMINNMVQRAMASIERIFDVMAEKPEGETKEAGIVLDEPKGRVSFENVTFSYDGKRDVLRDISFTAEPGEVIALVGPSGAGKTTVTNLLARFYDPQSGRVLIDGRDLCALKLSQYRKLLGMVLQEVFLFDGSIRENIAYARPKATKEEIIEAAKLANAHEFIEEFPAKYDEFVGERGVKVSGGQRQRISIARAILANPRVLILDEATSSLDSKSEAAIQEALSYLMLGRTTFVIAHRLSTIVNADRILVLENGELIEMGNHAELIRKKGLYYEMFMAQYERGVQSSDLAARVRWGEEKEKGEKDASNGRDTK